MWPMQASWQRLWLNQWLLKESLILLAGQVVILACAPLLLMFSSSFFNLGMYIKGWRGQVWTTRIEFVVWIRFQSGILYCAENISGKIVKQSESAFHRAGIGWPEGHCNYAQPPHCHTHSAFQRKSLWRLTLCIRFVIQISIANPFNVPLVNFVVTSSDANASFDCQIIGSVTEFLVSARTKNGLLIWSSLNNTVWVLWQLENMPVFLLCEYGQSPCPYTSIVFCDFSIHWHLVPLYLPLLSHPEMG